MKPEVPKKLAEQAPVTETEYEYYCEMLDRVKALGDLLLPKAGGRETILLSQAFVEYGAAILQAQGGYRLVAEQFYRLADAAVGLIPPPAANDDSPQKPLEDA